MDTVMDIIILGATTIGDMAAITDTDTAAIGQVIATVSTTVIITETILIIRFTGNQAAMYMDHVLLPEVELLLLPALQGVTAATIYKVIV